MSLQLLPVIQVAMTRDTRTALFLLGELVSARRAQCP